MVFNHQGQVAENVYHVLLPANPTIDDLVALVGTFDDWDAGAMHTHRVATSILFKIVGTDLSSAAGPRFEFFLPAPRAGTNASAPLPNNVTIAVSMRTGARGRSFRGRVFYIGLPASYLDTTGQSLNSTATTQTLSDWNALLGDVEAGGVGVLCVLSRRSGGVARANGIGTQVSSIVLADAFVDSQRRRLPAHNRHR